MIKNLFFVLGLIVTSSCNTTKIPKTLGDPRNNFSYGYHPLDPLPVTTVDTLQKENLINSRIMKSLPDESMRIAIGSISASGGLTFGSNGIGYKGQKYVVILKPRQVFFIHSTINFPAFTILHLFHANPKPNAAAVSPTCGPRTAQ
jgi:hypothetical protein